MEDRSTGQNELIPITGRWGTVTPSVRAGVSRAEILVELDLFALAPTFATIADWMGGEGLRACEAMIADGTLLLDDLGAVRPHPEALERAVRG